MSTIKVDTYLTRGGASEIAIDKLKGASSASSISVVAEGGTTTTNLQQGLAKQWATHSQAATYTLDDSFNVASITDNGTGETTVTFTNQPSNANYAVTFGTGFKNRFAIANANNTTRVKIEVYEVQGVQPAIDGADVHHTVHGDLA